MVVTPGSKMRSGRCFRVTTDTEILPVACGASILIHAGGQAVPPHTPEIGVIPWGLGHMAVRAIAGGVAGRTVLAMLSLGG